MAKHSRIDRALSDSDTRQIVDQVRAVATAIMDEKGMPNGFDYSTQVWTRRFAAAALACSNPTDTATQKADAAYDAALYLINKFSALDGAPIPAVP